MTDERKELEAVAADLSPFSPFKDDPHEFEIRGAKYGVKRPKPLASLELQRRVQVLMMNTTSDAAYLAGRPIEELTEAQVFLPEMVKTAPDHWFKDGKVDLELVELDELGAVWRECAKHWPHKLSRFLFDEKKADGGTR